MRTLDMGCGDYKVSSEWINQQLKIKEEHQVVGIGLHTDIDLNPNIDVNWDLNQFPYPFKDNEFDVVVALNILEHLEDIEKVIKEIYRITKNRGKIIIVVPHDSGVGTWCSVQHKRGFNTLFFSHGMIDYGFKPIVVKVRYIAESRKDRIGYRKHNAIIIFLASRLDIMANKNLYIFERFWRNWFGGFNEIYAIMEVIK